MIMENQKIINHIFHKWYLFKLKIIYILIYYLDPVLKEEIASMVEKKQKQLEEQNKQMKQKEGMGRKEEIKEVGGLKKTNK